MDAKCNCQNCNGHISFPAEMAGQTITCPHCNLPTIIFVPPPVSSAPMPKKKMSTTKKLMLCAVAVCVVGVVTIVCLVGFVMVFNQVPKTSSSRRNQTTINEIGLKPANEAFGYALGENGQEISIYNSETTNALPPFTSVGVDVTPDGKICQITGEGADEYDFLETKKRLISVLSEKYGLRENYEFNKGEKTYIFGTTNRSVWLVVADEKNFNIRYFDQQLLDIYYKAANDEKKSEDLKKKADLSKGL